MKKIFPVLILIAIAALVAWVWLKPLPQAEAEKPGNPEIPVRTGKIIRTTLRGYVTAYGMVEPEPTASSRVATPVPGVVTEVKCAEGQRVEAGALLFQLDSRAADIAVNFAEKSLDRQKRLGVGEGTSQKAMQEAEQQLAAARAQQSLLKIGSPLAGTVTRVNARPGEAADLTTVMAEVVDLDRLVLSANVPPAELASVKIGQAAELFDGDSTNVIAGRITFISPQVDAKSGTSLVRIALPKDAAFKPGRFLKARIIVEEHKDCLAVSLSSLATDDEGIAKIVLAAEGKPLIQPVKVGLRDENWVEVEAENLKPDMAVLTDGAYELIRTERSGVKIRIEGDSK